MPLDLLQALSGLLGQLAADPLLYSLVFFVYSVAATVFLPFPILIGLFLSPATPFLVKAVVMSSGKAVGSLLAFALGREVGGWLVRWTLRLPRLRWIMEQLQAFVARTRYWGLYIILSIPGMFDTIPLYIFALFNRNGLMKVSNFALVSFLSGMTRALLVWLILEIFGITIL